MHSILCHEHFPWLGRDIYADGQAILSLQVVTNEVDFPSHELIDFALCLIQLVKAPSLPITADRSLFDCGEAVN